MAADDGRRAGVADALWRRTYSQRVGDGNVHDGDAECPSLLRRLDHLAADIRN